MSYHAEGSSNTVSSGEAGDSSHDEQGLSSLRRCVDLVAQYRNGEKSKAEAIIDVQTAIADSSLRTSATPHESVKRAFATYLDMLDQVDVERAEAKRRGKTIETRDSSVDEGIGGEPNDRDGRDELHARVDPGAEPRVSKEAHREDSEDDDEGVGKRRRLTVDESLFPWRPSSEVIRSTLPSDLQQTLDLLNNWASDPTFVVRKILLSPGCPDFPPDQWLQVVKGLAVDLNKVLGAHYSTEVDSKQTQDIGEVFQLSVKLPRQTKTVRTHGEWVIAFGKTIQAVSYVLPSRREEYLAWEGYVSQLFAAVQPTHHERVIEFDRAVRLRVAHQKHVRLHDFARFEDL